MGDWLPAVMVASFALPNVLMGVRLLGAWRRPMAVEDGAWVRLGVGVFLLEFVLCHGGVFLGALGAGSDTTFGKMAFAGGLLLFYGLFAALISHAFRSRMLFESFLWVMGGRLVALTTGIFGDAGPFLIKHSAVAVGLYIAAAFASVVAPIPRLGVTPEVAAATMKGTGTGLWVEEPHRALASGAAYYLLLAGAEVMLLL